VYYMKKKEERVVGRTKQYTIKIDHCNLLRAQRLYPLSFSVDHSLVNSKNI
jgi:hypothetical protein